jgi:protein-S-isoprenylcysteine O-methyltransferase Ste14
MTVAIAKAIFVLAVAAWFGIRYPHQRRSRATPVRSSLRDRRETILLAIAATGLSIIPLVYVATGFPRAEDHLFVPVSGWLGTLVFVAALLLFYCAHHDLGRNFSSSLKVREGHCLVTTGVYRYVRHPIYASFWLWSAAQALLLPNWLAGSAGFIGFSVLFFGRVTREERMMLEIFGEDYRAYMARTARIVPGIH